MIIRSVLFTSLFVVNMLSSSASKADPDANALVGIYVCQPNPTNCQRNWNTAQVKIANGVLIFCNEATKPDCQAGAYDKSNQLIWVEGGWPGAKAFFKGDVIDRIEWDNQTKWQH